MIKFAATPNAISTILVKFNTNDYFIKLHFWDKSRKLIIVTPSVITVHWSNAMRDDFFFSRIHTPHQFTLPRLTLKVWKFISLCPRCPVINMTNCIRPASNGKLKQSQYVSLYMRYAYILFVKIAYQRAFKVHAILRARLSSAFALSLYVPHSHSRGKWI